MDVLRGFADVSSLSLSHCAPLGSCIYISDKPLTAVLQYINVFVRMCMYI